MAWLAEWIVAEKRRTHPEGLYVFGVQGTIGRGKSIFGRILAEAINHRLSREEGRAVSRSLDDYYLPKKIRSTPTFQARGYAPSGISNRGPAGTHDLPLLMSHLKAMEKSTAQSALVFPAFDKQADDRKSHGLAVRGRIGIFILDGWFVGAKAPKAMRSRPGLATFAAKALRRYQPLFKRLDALWAFDPISMMDIVRERVAQQKTLNRQSGRLGMSVTQVRRFVEYFYKEAWIPGLTTPTPPASRVTFHATMDSRREWIRIREGLNFNG